MYEYHKIQNIYDRDTLTNKLIGGQFRVPSVGFLKDCKWIATEKVDGTNIRIHWNGTDVIFGGRTDGAQLPAPLVEWLNKKFQTIEARNLFKIKFPDADKSPVTFYGEGYGAKIQKGGGLYSPEQKFVIFDVRIGQWWLERGNVIGIAETFGIDVIPVVKEGTLDELVAFVKSNPKSTWGDFEMEGVVARPVVELYTISLDRIIVKIKCRDFK